ncbi:hypothetical protein BDK51DRAFT_50691, partial [Blyttiomyces helicus]
MSRRGRLMGRRERRRRKSLDLNISRFNAISTPRKTLNNGRRQDPFLPGYASTDASTSDSPCALLVLLASSSRPPPGRCPPRMHGPCRDRPHPRRSPLLGAVELEAPDSALDEFASEREVLEDVHGRVKGVLGWWRGCFVDEHDTATTLPLSTRDQRVRNRDRHPTAEHRGRLRPRGRRDLPSDLHNGAALRDQIAFVQCEYAAREHWLCVSKANVEHVEERKTTTDLQE